jgi:hypothetical protein
MYLFTRKATAQSRYSIDFGFDVQSSNDSERDEGIKTLPILHRTLAWSD